VNKSGSDDLSFYLITQKLSNRNYNFSFFLNWKNLSGKKPDRKPRCPCPNMTSTVITIMIRLSYSQINRIILYGEVSRELKPAKIAFAQDKFKIR